MTPMLIILHSARRCCRQRDATSAGSQGMVQHHYAQSGSHRPGCRSRRAWRLWAATCGALLALSACPTTAQQRLHAEITRHHPKIYVAPLPDVFNYRVLTDYDVKRFFHQFGTDPQSLVSNPLGPLEDIVDDMELRNSYMYGVDVVFHQQLLQSPLRVHSQEEADFVYLPFYAALECRLSQAAEGGAHARAYSRRVEQFWDSIDTRFPHYRTKPHFMAIGRREAELLGGCGVDDKMYTKVDACSLLCHEEAKHLHVLTVEVWTGNLEKMAAKRKRLHSIPVPWPGHLHLSAGSPYFSRRFDQKAAAAKKQYIAMESLRVRFPLRKKLHEQCGARPAKCLHYKPRGEIGKMNQTRIYEKTQSAWFCLQPYGDGPSRHVTMDCMAADTVPVLFDKYLAQHSAFADLVDYSEFAAVVDPAELESSNVVDILEQQYDPTARLKLMKRLHQIKHIFLYAVNPMHTLARFDEMAAVHPRDDAFTSSLKALMRHACAHGTLPAARCPQTAAARTAAGAQHLRGGGAAGGAADSTAYSAET